MLKRVRSNMMLCLTREKSSSLLTTVSYIALSSSVILVEFSFGLLTKAVQERVDLFCVVVGCEARCNSELLKSTQPSWPMVWLVKIEGLRRLQTDLGHSGDRGFHSFTAATMWCLLDQALGR